MRYILDVAPFPKPRMVKSDAWKQRPAVVAYWDKKAKLQDAARQAGYILGAAFEVEFHIPMPASWSEKKKNQMVGTKHQQRPDLDNLEKALVDCLAVGDDSYVWQKISSKMWSRTGYIIIHNL